VLIEFAEMQRVDVDRRVGPLEEAARRAQILDNEMPNAAHHLAVVFRQHPLMRRIAQRDGDQIKCSFHPF
jgi:hypothetical protein